MSKKERQARVAELVRALLDDSDAETLAEPRKPRHTTRLDKLATTAARVDVAIEERTTPKHGREVHFVAKDSSTELFVARGIRQAETWLAGFMQAKAA